MDSSGLLRKRSVDKTGSEDQDRQMPWSYGGGSSSSMRKVAKPQSDSTCTTVSCCIGALLIFLGIALMWWADLDTLQKELAASVKQEVDLWEQVHKTPWQATQWDLFINGTEIGQLLPSAKTSVLEETSGLSVTTAQRTRMNILGTVFPFPRNSTVQEGAKGQPVTDDMQQQVKIEVQATRPGSAQQKVQLYQGPLVWSVSKTSNSWKGCHYADRGHWDSAARKCILWRFLSNLCVKLELDAVTGVWRTNKRFGDVGCNVFQQYHPVGTQRLPVTNWRVSTPPSITIEQGYKSTIVIYDAHDPYLFASNMTQGGMVLAEDRINEVALGITSGLFGFVLMVPFILLKIIALFEPRTKQDQPFDEIPFYACEVDNH